MTEDRIIREIMEAAGATHLRDLLRSRSTRQFAMQVALTDELTKAVKRSARSHKMRIAEVIDAMICALCSCVQSQAPEGEWGDVGAVIAEEIRRRMTVTGVNDYEGFH